MTGTWRLTKYSSGYRYCTRCRRFFPRTFRCPECGILLRRRPRRRSREPAQLPEIVEGD